jgi:peptidylprolyl isomerase
MTIVRALIVAAIALGASACNKPEAPAEKPAAEKKADKPAEKKADKPAEKKAEPAAAAKAPPAPAKPVAPGQAMSLDAPADVAAAPADAAKTASGLASKVIVKGGGTDKPSATSRVKVHYTGWTTDGKMFDSSVKRGQPAVFPLNAVIKGWTEGVQLMVVGERRRFWIPANLAYGENPRPGAPKGMLVFDVELLEIL